MLHRLPVDELEVSTTLSPWQKVKGEPEIVGAGGSGLVVTVIPADGGLVHPSRVCVTVYVPAVLALIETVVSVLLHRLPTVADEVSVTLSPTQKVVGPPAVIVGAGGIGLTTTTTVSDEGLVQPSSVCVT